MRIDADADIGTARITADKRVNIFYYPIDTWADFIFFNFCMDRGAGHQLEDVRQLLLRALGARHRGHLQGGEVPHPPRRVLGEAARRGPHDARRGPGDARQVVHPHHEHLRAPRLAEERRSTGSYRLKLRDNDEVRQAFADEVAELCESGRARRARSGSRSGTGCPKRRRSRARDGVHHEKPPGKGKGCELTT